MSPSRCVGLVMMLAISCACLSIASAFQSAEEAAAPSRPADVVNAFHDVLLEAMKAGQTADFSHRMEMLEPVIRDSFDLAYITKTVLGNHWDALTEDQRKQFYALFSKFMITTYASKFNNYTGETFEFIDASEERTKVYLVRTRFTESGGKVRKFDYQLLNRKDMWRIVNIAVDGVSDLSLKRVEYSDVMDKDGFDALIKLLEQRIRELEQDA